MAAKPRKTKKSAAIIGTITREEWLRDLMHAIAKEIFEPVEEGSTAKIGTWRVSCGWPGGGSARKRIGECWSETTSKNGSTEMFISPMLGTVKEVDHVLVHEMVHASVGTECGHRGAFVKLARKVGLTEGKMTATLPNSELRAKLDAITKVMVPYPHGALSLKDRKKQSTRMLKLNCQDCGYIVRTTAKWVEEGLPVCHCGGKFTVSL